MIIKMELTSKHKKILFIISLVIALLAVFIITRYISPDSLGDIKALPLPILTILIAIVDGFNPCNIFVLTCFLVLLVDSAASLKRLYLVSGCFIGVVFVLYFLFMAAWLNVFSYFHLVTPLRISIAIFAIIIGLIDCKELLFFKKGVSRTIHKAHRGLLYQKMHSIVAAMEHESIILLMILH